VGCFNGEFAKEQSSGWRLILNKTLRFYCTVGIWNLLGNSHFFKFFGEKFINTFTHTHSLLIIKFVLREIPHHHILSAVKVACVLLAICGRFSGIYAVFSYDVDWGFHLFDYFSYQGNGNGMFSMRVIVCSGISPSL